MHCTVFTNNSLMTINTFAKVFRDGANVDSLIHVAHPRRSRPSNFAGKIAIVRVRRGASSTFQR